MGCSGSKTETEPSPNKAHQEVMEFKFELHEKTVEQFLVLEREINAYEKRHIPETLQVRQDQMHQLKKTLQRMEQDFTIVQKDIAQQTPMKVSGKQNNENTENSVRNFLMGQDKYDEMTAFEKADHLATLNKHEILRKEIDGTKHHVVELQQEIDILEDDMKDLRELYENEDKLLDSLFHGEYGSEKENCLEEQLDSLEIKLQRIEEANFKWRQAQVMIEYACKQIGTAVEKWEEIIKTPFGNMEARYKLAEETRNNLIAAGQNIQGAQRYLPHIKFPYCTPEEVNMLNKATSYVFTDMQAKARQAHALEVCGAAHRRAAALLQWFNETINSTIKHDLMGVKDKVKETSTKLRRERVELIKHLVKEHYGIDVEIKSADVNLDDDSEHEFEMGSAGKNHDMSQRGSYSDLSYSALPNAPSPIPLEELAPQPTREDLFGKLDELTKQHQQQVQKMANGMKANKLRTQRGLDSKLTQRRDRRTRSRHQAEQEQEILQHAEHAITNGGEKVMMNNNNNNNMNNINNHQRQQVNKHSQQPPHHQQQQQQQQYHQQKQPQQQQRNRQQVSRLPHQAEDRLEDVDGDEIIGRPTRNSKRY